MHEMGVVLNIVRDVEQAAAENQVEAVAAVVLQIGELTGVIPHYVRACWPAAIENTCLSKAELVIEEVVGNGRCADCGRVYNLLAEGTTCPACGSKRFEVLSGREVMIKEIAAY